MAEWELEWEVLRACLPQEEDFPVPRKRTADRSTPGTSSLYTLCHTSKYQTLLSYDVMCSTQLLNRKLFIRGLDYNTSVEELQDVFQEYGEIEDCVIPSDRHTGKSKYVCPPLGFNIRQTRGR